MPWVDTTRGVFIMLGNFDDDEGKISASHYNPRLARPARIVVERCHAMSVWRSSVVRRIMRDV